MTDDLLQGINADHSEPKASTHAPDLSVESGNLVVDLSDHSETDKHHTSFVEIYIDGTPAGYLKVEPQYWGGVLEFNLPEDEDFGQVRARAKCNLHGTWETTLSL